MLKFNHCCLRYSSERCVRSPPPPRRQQDTIYFRINVTKSTFNLIHNSSPQAMQSFTRGGVHPHEVRALPADVCTARLGATSRTGECWNYTWETRRQLEHTPPQIPLNAKLATIVLSVVRDANKIWYFFPTYTSV